MTLSLVPSLRRAGLGLAAGALVATGGLVAPGAAQAAPADPSAGWLAGQLKDGLMYNSQFDFNDYGLTADSGYALIEVGGRRAAVAEMRDALAPKVDSWTTGVDFGSSDVYAGSVAKALVFAQQAPQARPRSFGGVNLVRRMENRVSTDAPSVGRIEDKGARDYANTIGQAFAVRGLSVAGSALAQSATAFLLQQQCDGGYFRLSLGDAGEATQGCEADGGAPDPDTTSLALLNLQAVPDPDPAVRASIRSGLTWLAGQQRANGSFGGGSSTESSNTNSTGLAAWTLGQGGRCAKARVGGHVGQEAAPGQRRHRLRPCGVQGRAPGRHHRDDPRPVPTRHGPGHPGPGVPPRRRLPRLTWVRSGTPPRPSWPRRRGCCRSPPLRPRPRGARRPPASPWSSTRAPSVAGSPRCATPPGVARRPGTSSRRPASP